MRIPLSNLTKLRNRVYGSHRASPLANRSTHGRQSQQGVAVIVMLALLSIMLLFIAAGSHSLYRLHRELQLTEQKQVRRLHVLSLTNLAVLHAHAMHTNSPPVSAQPPPTLPAK